MRKTSEIVKTIWTILTDTLKEDGQFEPTKISVFVAFNSAILMAWVDFIKNDYRIDYAVWATIFGYGISATGMYMNHLNKKTKYNAESKSK